MFWSILVLQKISSARYISVSQMTKIPQKVTGDRPDVFLYTNYHTAEENRLGHQKKIWANQKKIGTALPKKGQRC
jgi:hypothetical protein